MAARIPTMTTTISNSINVKAERDISCSLSPESSPQIPADAGMPASP